MSATDIHRPWPVPRRPWIMAMEWHNLAFLHWPVSPAQLAGRLPPGLPLDTLDGEAWISITPLHMRGVRPRLVPPLPGISQFPELNVRTYVTLDGKPGIWFFSLDAANPLAVRGARVSYRLPYFDARMSIAEEDGVFHFQSVRRSRRAPAALSVRYRPTGGLYRAEPGTRDHFLIERYCLYTADRQGRIYRGEIHHAPWPLQPAEAWIYENTMTRPFGVELPSSAPLVHYAGRLDVTAWNLERVV